MITEADEQNPLNFGSNVGHNVSIIIFLEITTLYTKFLLLFTDATEPKLPDKLQTPHLTIIPLI